MESQNKKQRGGKWTENQLKAALEAVQKGKMSQRKAAATFNVPRRTLRNHIKSGSTKKIIGRTPVLNKTQEKDLCKRVIRLAQVGLPLTSKIVRKQAYEFCKANSIPNSFNDNKNIAGKKWLKNFVKRNPEISLRRAQLMNPARAQKLNKYIVQQHFNAIKTIYEDLNICNHPERLYNMDEKGCRLTIHHQHKVFAAKGTKRVHFVAQEHAENVTIAMCVNAAGNSVPPMVIFKGKRLRPEFCDNMPPGTLVKMGTKGSMTTELFVEFINHLGQFKSQGKCLLIFDGASSHLDARIVDAADAHDIVLYCLPSNTTHELQPLDKSVNKSYEHFWDEEVLLYAYQHPGRKLTKTRFSKIFTKVWSKCTTKENIINGFRATGLFPYDPNAIPEEAYAPSALTQLPNPRDIEQNVSSINDSTSDIMSASRTSIIRSSLLSPRRDNMSDTDVTDCEENLKNLSPSILTENAANEWTGVIEQRNVQNPQSSNHITKLVDYSSSLESNMDLQEQLQMQPFLNINFRYSSPVPTTSGTSNIQPRPRLNSITSDSSEEEGITTFLKNFQYPSKLIDIYTSSSDSNEENLNPNFTELLPISEQMQIQSEDSEDNLPLLKLKNSPHHVP
ncbi:unnamed protein product [Parnassius apollo]|uniref:(apollo) hypothetical protein n=1 Tax=Parnassius apollo TaxID=110799 RepID=A0A8S3XSL8_PARAO|nr:unnamed protein product [Parnassius apollo]